MEFRIGGSFGEEDKILETDRVRITAPDGRDMFEINLCRDGISFEIVAITTTKVEGVLYRDRFSIEPNAANQATVRLIKY